VFAGVTGGCGVGVVGDEEPHASDRRATSAAATYGGAETNAGERTTSDRWRGGAPDNETLLGVHSESSHAVIMRRSIRAAFYYQVWQFWVCDFSK
jgi:hypothetical protein